MMMTEEDEIRRKLRDAFFLAFDRWGAKEFDALVNPEIRKNNPEAFEGMYLEDLFMSKRVFIPGFYRHVTQSLLASADSQRQLRTVTKGALISILKDEGVSVRELERTASDEQMYTRRNVQNLLRQRYANTFFEHGSRAKNDGNVRPYLSVFSLDVEPPLAKPREVKALQDRDMEILKSNARTMEWLMLNGRIETILPEKIRFAIAFKKLCAQLMLEIGDHTKKGQVLTTELSTVTEIFQLFANHILSIAFIALFNGRQEPTKRKLIHDGFPLEYTEEDARLACLLLAELLGSEGITATNVLVSAEAFVQYGYPEAALRLYEQCVRLPRLDPSDTGILHENTAVIHRKNGNPKLMIQEMKLAIDSYKEGHDPYRVAVALKNLGEAEWMLGYAPLAIEYFAQAERLGETMENADRANLYANLAASAMRLKRDRLEIKYMAEFLKCAPEEWTGKILNASARLGELMRKQS
jgi:tetratricopeptide (TPR) repeat protein